MKTSKVLSAKALPMTPQDKPMLGASDDRGGVGGVVAIDQETTPLPHTVHVDVDIGVLGDSHTRFSFISLISYEFDFFSASFCSLHFLTHTFISDYRAMYSDCPCLTALRRVVFFCRGVISGRTSCQSVVQPARYIDSVASVVV